MVRAFALLISSLLLHSLSIAQLTFHDVTEQKGFVPSVPGDAHGSGVAATDYDQDGDIDLYVCTESGYPDLLYQNNGDGSFTSIGEQVGLESIVRSRMALWIDYNGNRKLDLLVSGDCDFDESDCPDASFLRLYQQQSDGSFEEMTDDAGLSGFGAKRKDQTLGGLAAADVNNDGNIDFVQVIRNGPLELFVNQGDGSFLMLSEQYGFDTDEFKYYQPMFHDFNSDGLIDLYCNVDFDDNQLWINNEDGQFIEMGRVTRSDSDFNEMGITLGDYDNDGDFDIYATNIHNYFGQDVHNVLLENISESDFIGFSEQSKSKGIHEGGWGWGATFFDANNDGFLDLAATNGWDVPFEVLDTSKFWVGNQGAQFTDLSDSVRFNDNLNAATLIAFDYDRDGDLDMLQTIKGKSFSEPKQHIRLLENTIDNEHRGSFLVIKPRMTGRNHFAIGATVRAYFGENQFARLIHSGTSFYGQEPAEAFFGLGTIEELDSLKINWPGGNKSTWYDLPTNQVLELTFEEILSVNVPLNQPKVYPTLLKSNEVSRINIEGISLVKSITLHDLEGRELPFLEFKKTNSDRSTIAIGQLKSGVYFLRINDSITKLVMR